MTLGGGSAVPCLSSGVGGRTPRAISRARRLCRRRRRIIMISPIIQPVKTTVPVIPAAISGVNACFPCKLLNSDCFGVNGPVGDGNAEEELATLDVVEVMLIHSKTGLEQIVLCKLQERSEEDKRPL